jgi:hypothetical protein
MVLAPQPDERRAIKNPRGTHVWAGSAGRGPERHEKDFTANP